MSVSILLMVLDHREAYFVEIRSALTVIVSPVQFAVHWPLQLVGWIDSSVTSHQSLLQENADLRAEQILLRAQVQQLISLEKENKQLRALLQSTPRVQGKVVAAQLLAVDTDPFNQEVILDGGSRAGFYVGQPVLDANGVMGQIIKVGPLTSLVLLLTDTRSAIPVQVSSNGIRAIAKGTGTADGLVLLNIPKTTEIKSGELLVSSGLGQRFPQGYPVGTVKNVISRPGDHFAEITVTPAAHLDRSRLVLLVWPDERTRQLAIDVHKSSEKTEVIKKKPAKTRKK